MTRPSVGPTRTMTPSAEALEPQWTPQTTSSSAVIVAAKSSRTETSTVDPVHDDKVGGVTQLRDGVVTIEPR